jgi:2,3-bisphosphoglycerate-independent phosphoglycerate mutase
MSAHYQRPPCGLIILDGWGIGPTTDSNAIHQATTPHWDFLQQHCPQSALSASGKDVGLPDGQMGNSEVGHLHLGAGRCCPQDLVTINDAIARNTFKEREEWHRSLQHCQSSDKAVHLMGLLSEGGVHSHITHILAAIEIIKHYPSVPCYIHAFTDGRDTAPTGANDCLQRLLSAIEQAPHCHLASVCGRFYAMDRDQRWDRTHALTAALLSSKTPRVYSPKILIEAYEKGITDEFLPPMTFDHQPLSEGDAVWFLNFRADRARQLIQSLTAPVSSSLQPPALQWLTLTDYGIDIDHYCVFAKPKIEQSLGACIASAGLRQLRLAETEKYAHVTYFLNGGEETPYPNETRIMVPSPAVITYDKSPEMSAAAITDALIEQLDKQQTDVFFVNFANADMVGHTGDQTATETAITTLDYCLKRITDALDRHQGHCLITADHGNAEQMVNARTGQQHTAHTTNPVPLLYYGKHIHHLRSGTLCDVAPTMLSLLGIPIPDVMTGHDLAADS